MPGAKGTRGEKSRTARQDRAQRAAGIATGSALTWIHSIKENASFLPGSPGALGGDESMCPSLPGTGSMVDVPVMGHPWLWGLWGMAGASPPAP